MAAFRGLTQEIGLALRIERRQQGEAELFGQFTGPGLITQPGFRAALNGEAAKANRLDDATEPRAGFKERGVYVNAAGAQAGKPLSRPLNRRRGLRSS